ncbi:MAG: SDR family oxidoreductase [Opitutae bacterium]|nr:SDR family oxidoreductase [Opitutae bacterium]
MKLAITGALGHIGSGLIHDIRSGEFDEVLLVDNLATQRYCSLFRLPRGVSFRFVEADILTADLSAMFRGMDAVIHLAALTDAANSFERRKEVMEINLEGTRRVAQASLENGCRLFFPSTTSVYGVQTGRVDETCLDLAPQSPYAASKLAAERCLLDMRGEGLRVAVCRLGTIFGPSIGMRFHTAVNKFIWQAAMGQPLTVWTAAMDQKRPYLDLQDAVRAIRFILAASELDGPLYNIVTLNGSVRNILDSIRKQIPAFTVQQTDSPIMNQLSYEVSADRFAALGFEFRGDLDRGVAATVEQLKGR